MDFVSIYIDADNISHKIMPILFNRIKQLGLIGVLKVYRDWSQTDSTKWSEVAQENKMEAVQCFRQAHKQSTDIYMITDILNDLYTLPKNDIVIMITCDSDFNHLCHQVLKLGKKLIIVGKDSSIATICYQFWNIDDFLVPNKKIKNEEKKITIISDEEIDFLITPELLFHDTSPNNYKEELIKGMNNNYVLKLNDLKKEIKKLLPNIKLNLEKELNKYSSDFLLFKNKQKVIVLYIPEILIKKCNMKKKDIIKLINDKYPNIINYIKIDILINLIYGTV
jgi:hypothetical protein